MFLDRYSNICLDICPKKFYGDTINFVCNACDESCTNCLDPNNSDCLACETALGFYTVVVANESNNKVTCLPCH